MNFFSKIFSVQDAVNFEVNSMQYRITHFILCSSNEDVLLKVSFNQLNLVICSVVDEYVIMYSLVLKHEECHGINYSLLYSD